MTLSDDRPDPWLLDEEVWDIPSRLTRTDLLAHAGASWGRGTRVLDDPEDEQ